MFMILIKVQQLDWLTPLMGFIARHCRHLRVRGTLRCLLWRVELGVAELGVPSGV